MDVLLSRVTDCTFTAFCVSSLDPTQMFLPAIVESISAIIKLEGNCACAREIFIKQYL